MPLHPVRPIHRASWSDEANEISSAMLVEWEGLRLLLGADVPNTQWPGIAADFPALADHHAMKIPHHGSREAIHDAFGIGLDTRTWVVTPYQRQGLPARRTSRRTLRMVQKGLSAFSPTCGRCISLRCPFATTGKPTRRARRPALTSAIIDKQSERDESRRVLTRPRQRWIVTSSWPSTTPGRFVTCGTAAVPCA